MKKILLTLLAVLLLISCESGFSYKTHNAAYYPYLDFEFDDATKNVVVTIVEEVENPIIPGSVNNYETIFGGIKVTGSKGPGAEEYIKESIKSLTLGLKHIDNNTISVVDYHDNITNITLLDSVNTLYHTFAFWQKLETVDIGNGVEDIGGWTFSYCWGLKDLTIGNNVKNIGTAAFSYCKNLTSVTIPNSVTNIDNGAFSNCFALNNLTIGNSVKNIGSVAFENNTSLKNVIIPNSVETIGKRAFYGCTSLESISLPAGTYNLSDILPTGDWFVNGEKIQDLTNFVATDRKQITRN